MIRSLFKSLLNLFYPNNCLICSETLIKGEDQICLLCLNDIPRTNYHLKEGNPVEMRFWGKVEIERASSFFFFNKGSAFQYVIHDLKYRGNKEIGVLFGRIAAADLLESAAFRTIDVIVPVPIHKKKEAKRGFNQSEMIARGIAEMMHKELVCDNLYRALEKTSQTDKSVFERYENTKDVFAIRDIERFENKHILLVDDVLTTGSTLESCVKVLQESKGVKISIFTLALSM